MSRPTAVAAPAPDEQPAVERRELAIEATVILAQLQHDERAELDSVRRRYDARVRMFLAGVASGLGIDPARVRGVDLKADPAVLLLAPDETDG